MATLIVIGRLTTDAKKNKDWTNFTVAENKTIGDEKITNFFNCKSKNLSDAQFEYLKKGKRVEILGDINFETYEKEGEIKYTHSVYIYKIDFVT